MFRALGENFLAGPDNHAGDYLKRFRGQVIAAFARERSFPLERSSQRTEEGSFPTDVTIHVGLSVVAGHENLGRVSKIKLADYILTPQLFFLLLLVYIRLDLEEIP